MLKEAIFPTRSDISQLSIEEGNGLRNEVKSIFGQIFFEDFVAATDFHNLMTLSIIENYAYNELWHAVSVFQRLFFHFMKNISETGLE